MFTALSLLPIALDGLRVSYPWVPRLPFFLTNYTLFAMTIIFISSATYVWLSEWFPYFIRTSPTPFLVNFHLIFGTFLSINMLSNLYVAHRIGGRIYSGFGRSLPEKERRFCKKCDQNVPLRSHHCHVCNGCVMAFDHHCPFVASCVGDSNRSRFFLFLTYLFLGSTYAVVLAWGVFSECILHSEGQDLVRCQVLGRNSYLFLPFLFVWCLTLLLLFWQLFVIYTDKTTYEILTGKQTFSEILAKGSLSKFSLLFEEEETAWMVILFPWMSLILGQIDDIVFKNNTLTN